MNDPLTPALSGGHRRHACATRGEGKVGGEIENL